MKPLLLTVSAALLACSTCAFAQSQSSGSITSRTTQSIQWTGHGTPPPCVYKGVMTDAEIQACTGRAVHYDYSPIFEAPARPAGT